VGEKNNVSPRGLGLGEVFGLGEDDDDDESKARDFATGARGSETQ